MFLFGQIFLLFYPSKKSVLLDLALQPDTQVLSLPNRREVIYLLSMHAVSDHISDLLLPSGNAADTFITHIVELIS